MVGLWGGTGLSNCTGINNRIDKSVTSCGNPSAVRVFGVRSNIANSCSSVSGTTRLLLARYGCCATVAMTIMSIMSRSLLLWSGMSIPGVLFAIPWLVLLRHALGLVRIRFASAFIDFRQNWCVVMCLFSLWWQRSVRGASFVEWWFDTVLLVRIVVRMGGQSISK